MFSSVILLSGQTLQSIVRPSELVDSASSRSRSLSKCWNPDLSTKSSPTPSWLERWLSASWPHASQTSQHEMNIVFLCPLFCWEGHTSNLRDPTTPFPKQISPFSRAELQSTASVHPHSEVFPGNPSSFPLWSPLEAIAQMFQLTVAAYISVLLPTFCQSNRSGSFITSSDILISTSSYDFSSKFQ